MQGLYRLLRCSDFHRNPARALWRRFIWRLRWQVSTEPWLLPLGEDLKIAVPKCGGGALIYYQGFSEPETADFILRFIKPGMVFLDIGAHVGEYTLLGAQAVGPEGEVHAFEPNPDIFWLLSDNVHRNNLSNVVLNKCAVCNLDGEREFEVYTESSVSSLRSLRKEPRHLRKQAISKVISVPSVRLDTYWAGYEKKIHLVKVDVEGAELLVFLGAERLLSLLGEEAPVWVFEYAPPNYARFGYRHDDLLGLLKQHSYDIWHYGGAGQLIPFDPDSIPPGTINLIAAKDRIWLRPILRTR